MTTIIDTVDGFSLGENLDDHVAFLKAVPHEQAVKEEAVKLRPLFNAMAEYVQGCSVDYNGNSGHITFDAPTRRLHRYFQHDKNLDVTSAQLECAFIGLAKQHKSLVLSDMPLTTLFKVKAYANTFNQDFDKYDGQSTSAFPDLGGVSSFGGWGFVQVHKDNEINRKSKQNVAELAAACKLAYCK